MELEVEDELMFWISGIWLAMVKYFVLEYVVVALLPYQFVTVEILTYVTRGIPSTATPNWVNHSCLNSDGASQKSNFFFHP
jgi:hypothetical protein